MDPELRDLVSGSPPAGRLARDSSALRTFTFAEGVVMLVLGVLALIFPVLASVWVTAMVAIGFLVSGIVGWVNTLARTSRLSTAISFWRFTVSTLFLVAGPSVPARTIAELVALAKSKPGEISSASSGNGSTGHIATEVFSSRAGVKLMNVFYKGNSQAVIDVISGQTNLIFDQVSTAASHVRAGKVRALAVTSTQRSPLFPDIPTMAEAGYPGYEDVTLNMLLAPAGTPKEIVAKIHADVAKAFAQPELVARFVERSIELVASPSPEEFGLLIRSEVARLGKVAREAGIKAE